MMYVDRWSFGNLIIGQTLYWGSQNILKENNENAKYN